MVLMLLSGRNGSLWQDEKGQPSREGQPVRTGDRGRRELGVADVCLWAPGPQSRGGTQGRCRG